MGGGGAGEGGGAGAEIGGGDGEARREELKDGDNREEEKKSSEKKLELSSTVPNNSNEHFSIFLSLFGINFLSFAHFSLSQIGCPVWQKEREEI